MASSGTRTNRQLSPSVRAAHKSRFAVVRCSLSNRPIPGADNQIKVVPEKFVGTPTVTITWVSGQDGTTVGYMTVGECYGHPKKIFGKKEAH